MNAKDPEDLEDIILAAQLSRIMCRKLELNAFAYLQKTLNNMSTLQAQEINKLAKELGLVLLILRWRLSWWTILGDGSNLSDTGKQSFECRVSSLCRVLYFYYCSARRKIPSWSDAANLNGFWCSYADTSLVAFDDFPQEESIDGFNAWMKRGQTLINGADAVGKMGGVGLCVS
jgi:hypothetical protein